MQCKQCGFDNPDGMKFCGQCADILDRQCNHCQFVNPGQFKFCGQCGKSLDKQQAAPTPQIPATDKEEIQDLVGPVAESPTDPSSREEFILDFKSGPAQHAERRQITVMFCDLVGSTALSAGIDPEDLRDIIGDYRATCNAVIAQRGGHIAQYLGDGILVYFGYPIANEDDAVRAIQSGLEIIANIKQLNQRLQQEKGIQLAVRIGIHTGQVVIGEIGSTDKNSLALGVTPNIAARLQDLAKPDTVVISAATHRLVNKHCETEYLGEHELRGYHEPVALYQVHCHRELHHYEDQSNLNLTPLIGREQESALILDRLDQARNGEGQVVLLSGEAGIGKSRLAQYLRAKIAPENHFLLDSWGSPYHQNSFLYSVVALLRRALDLDSAKNDQEKLSRLEQPLLALGIPLDDSVPLLAELLSIPLDDNYAPANLPPQQRKQKLLQTLLAIVLGMANQQLLVFIIEDLHWVDSTTLEFIGQLIDQVPSSNVLILLTFRLEFTPPWQPRSHVTQISINRLTRKQSGRMVKWLAHNKDLPLPVFNDIITKTDGTPFFVEELTKMVLESGLLKEHGDRYELAAPLSSLEIPSTLQDSLMAKLDRLGSNKELAQLSATIGREFAHKLLQAVVPDSAQVLNQRLSQLVGKELLYQRGLPPRASYTFRHALVHEVAYQSLLKKTRQHYHHKIAQVLHSEFPEMARENPELLAHHYHEAGHYMESVPHWIQAGKLALQRCAIPEASLHLNQGLSALENVPQGANRNQMELQLQVTLGLASMLLRGYAAPAVETAYARAYQLCELIGDNKATYPILCGLWEYYLVRAELDKALELALKIKDAAMASENTSFAFEAQRIQGVSHFWRGDLIEGYRHIQRGIDVKETTPLMRNPQMQYSQDTEVANLAMAGCSRWLMGYADQALVFSAQAVELAQQLNHQFSLNYALHFTAIIHLGRGDYEKTLHCVDQVQEIAERFGFMFWQATAGMLKSCVLMYKTPSEEHIESFEQSLALYRRTGSRIALTYFQSLLANMYLAANNFQGALQVVDNTMQELETLKECIYEPELLRIKAIAQEHLQNDPAVTENLFRQGIELAHQRGALSLELPLATSLAQFLQKEERVEEAQTVLSGVLETYTEGFNTKAWCTADALLTELLEEVQHTGV